MPIAVASRTREHGRWWEATHVTHARVRSAPTGGHRHQDGPASTGQPIHGVNQRQRSHRMTRCDHQQVLPCRAAGSVASSRAHVVEGAGARGALGSCMRRRRSAGADGTTEFQIRRGARLEKFQEDAARRGGRMAVVAGVAASPASATVPIAGQGRHAEQANVPYLAWRGEHVRLGYCDPLGRARRHRRRRRTTRSAGHIEDWSGDPANGSIPVPYRARRRTALRRQRLRLRELLVAEGRRRLHQARRHRSRRRTGATPADKQFMVGWMQINPPPSCRAAATVTAGDFNCEPAIQSNLRRRDVDGSLPRLRSDDNNPRHRVTVTVKGIIPLLAELPRVGPRRPPDAAGRLGKPGRRSRPATTSIDPTNALPAMTRSRTGTSTTRLAPDRGSRRHRRHAVRSARGERRRARPTRSTTARSRRRAATPPSATSRPLLDGLRPAFARRLHRRAVRPALPVRHAALRRQRRRG